MTDIVRKRKRRRPGICRIFTRFLQTCILGGIAAVVGMTIAMFISTANMLPTNSIEAPEATLIYSSDGVLLARIFDEDRTNVALKDMPKNLKNATVAIEDERFYQHSGVDVRGIARALVVNITHGETKEGGSTITQQLARNIYLSSDRTMSRKIREAILALLLEKNLSKDRILELYLNRTFYGNRTFGVEAASKAYFGKSVKDLNLSQCAMIAGLPARPSGYAPTKSMELATKRRDVVLRRMKKLGYITDAEYQKAVAEKIVIVKSSRRNNFKAKHFVSYVINQLKDRYGEELVYKGGLRVYTTLNYDMQQAGEDALERGVKRYGRAHRLSQGALAAIDVNTGYIKTMVGSATPDSDFNRCVQGNGRQPGSLFKAFVYTAAIAKGKTPNTTIVDAPVTFRSGGKPWSPKNFDRRYHGTVTMQTAVAQSMNIPAVKMCKEVGPKNVVKYAHDMGITSDIEPYLAIALGGVKGVKLLDICNAYGTFANNGVHMQPIAITKVTDTKGNVIEENKPKGNKVITPAQNRMMDQMFRAVMTSGTGRPIRGIADARGKTGTTNDNRDAWWAGYVPNRLVSVVWVGNDDYSPMYNAWGSNTCGYIWQNYMSKALPIFNKTYKGKPRKIENVDDDVRKTERRNGRGSDTLDEDGDSAFEPKESSDGMIRVRVCGSSGMRATRRCPHWRTKTFSPGEEPSGYCTQHGGGGRQSRPESTRQSEPAPRERDSGDTENTSSDDARSGRTRVAKSALGKRVASSSERSERSEHTVTVSVCPASGMIAGSSCPNSVRKTFTAGDMPSRICNIHGR